MLYLPGVLRESLGRVECAGVESLVDGVERCVCVAENGISNEGLVYSTYHDHKTYQERECVWEAGRFRIQWGSAGMGKIGDPPL